MRKLILASFMICLAGYCWGQMTPQYDSYVTYSTDSNNNFYQTIVVEGTTTGSCNTTCCQGSPYPPYYTCWSCQIQGCSTAVHTATITNVVNGVGGTTTSPGYDPFSYMSYQTTTSVYVAPGGQLTNSCGGSVSCSVVGNLGQLISGCPTPSEHTYPNGPLTNCTISQGFDRITRRKTKHGAQDVWSPGITVGTPVYAGEDGTVAKVTTGNRPATSGWPNCQGDTPPDPANAVYVQSKDGTALYTTRYVHITAVSGIANGIPVKAGQQIGTIDTSGCQKGPHVHVGRYDPNGAAVNFTLQPCTYPPGNQFSNDDLDDGDPTS